MAREAFIEFSRKMICYTDQMNNGTDNDVVEAHDAPIMDKVSDGYRGADSSEPLALRIRPHSLRDYIGQQHLVNSFNGLIINFIRLGYLPSMLLIGPPGVGKTTLASIIANECNYVFLEFSANDTSIADMRELSATIRKENKQRSQGTDLLKVVVFIDEIHRFSKKQQDFLLPFVEDGSFVFIGATTEPKRIRAAIASRCQLFQFKPHTEKDVLRVINRAIQSVGMESKQFQSGCLDLIVKSSNGDTRRAINIIEIVCAQFGTDVVKLSDLQQSINSLEVSQSGIQHETNGPILIKFFQALHGDMTDENYKREVIWEAPYSEEKTQIDEEESDNLFLDTFKETNFEESKEFENIHKIQVSDDEDENQDEIAPETTSLVSSRIGYFTELATFYLIKLLDAGEHPTYICRKLIVFATLYTRDDCIPKLLANLTMLRQTNNALAVLSQCVEWICRHVQFGKVQTLPEALLRLNQYHKDHIVDVPEVELEVKVDFSEEAIAKVMASTDTDEQCSTPYEIQYDLSDELRAI